MQSFNSDYLRRLVAGDRAAEEHFFRYFSEVLRIKLRARFRNPTLIEDLRQETLRRVFTAIKQGVALRSSESLGGFVNSVCKDLLFETYRRNVKSGAGELGDNDATDGHGGVEADLVSEGRRRKVRRVLNELSEKDRELLRLVFSGRAAICRANDVEREYLRALLHRAIERFRVLSQTASETQNPAIGSKGPAEADRAFGLNAG